MEQRIEKLERQCRWYRNLFILAGLIAVALVTWGATKPIPDLIQARMFQVVDSNGKTSMILGEDRGYGQFALLGPKGLLVTIGSNDVIGTGLVTVLSTRHKGSVTLVGSGYSGNGGVIQLTNKNREKVVKLLVDKYGNGVVGIYNRKGKGRTLKPGPQ
jgi:hypothetical protein